MPVVLHWCFDHFVVLQSIGRNSFTILDPARGSRKIGRKEFGESFTGLAIAFTPGEGFVASGRPQSVVSALLREAAQSRDALAVAFAVGLFSVVPALALTGATSAFVDHVLGGAGRKRNLALHIPMEQGRQQLAFGQVAGGAKDDEIEDFDRNGSGGHILLRFRF